jgi:hypothetical protein
MTARHHPRERSQRGARGPLVAVIVAVLFAMATALTGCAASRDTAPRCDDPLRLAIVAQSLPTASYVPCLRDLPQGWGASGFDATQNGTSFLLDSDRSPGRPVSVQLTATCRPGIASPSPPRAPGVLTYTRLTSVRPRFTGTLYDVFPGGCVSYAFDFAPESQIALMEQFERAVGLYPRQQLRLVLKQKLGVELNP